jgi:hypothetical protein
LTEQEFVDSFDTKFPYSNKEAASALIQQGWALSPNAAFFVLHEICRPPRGVEIETDSQHYFVSEWSEAGDHPLKPLLMGCAAALIDEVPMPWEKAVEAMQQIGAYDGQYAALSIAYFAGDSSSSEGDKALEDTDAVIRRKWDAQQN